MRQKFTVWYAKKYGAEKGPWWVELLNIFLWSPSVYCVELQKLFEQTRKKHENEMVRINVYSITNPDIDFDISVPRKHLDKVMELIPKCGRAWYNYEGFWELGWSEPLRMALDKLGINYIFHGANTDPDEVLADVAVAFA